MPPTTKRSSRSTSQKGKNTKTALCTGVFNEAAAVAGGKKRKTLSSGSSSSTSTSTKKRSSKVTSIDKKQKTIASSSKKKKKTSTETKKSKKSTKAAAGGRSDNHADVEDDHDYGQHATVRLASGYQMPLFGLGTWGGGADSEHVAKAVDTALSFDYPHIDCAEFYRNQDAIGKVFRKHFHQSSSSSSSSSARSKNKSKSKSKSITIPSSRKRQEVFITSKVWNTNHAPQHVRASCLQTLHHLQIDYIDLLLIHWPCAWRHTGLDFSGDGGGQPMHVDGCTTALASPPVSLQTTWQAMEALVDDGLVRSIGVSNYTAVLLADLMTYARIPPSVLQIEAHPFFPQHGLIEYCRRFNIHVTAYTPLGRPDKYNASILTHPTITKLARQYKCTPAAICIRWSMQRGVTVIPKSATPARIRDNVDASHLVRQQLLSSKAMQLIHNLAASSTTSHESSSALRRRFCDMSLGVYGEGRDELWCGYWN